MPRAWVLLATLATYGCHYGDWSLDAPGTDDGAPLPSRDARADAPAPTDAGPQDTSPPRDASTAGDGDADAAPLTWCATQGHHSLCADFDEGQAAKGWTTQLLSTGGTMTLDSTFTTSPPDALLTTLGPSPTATTTALFERLFPNKETTWAFAFDVRIDAIDAGTSGGDYSFARIWGASQSRVTLHTDGSSVWVDEDIPTVDAGSFSRYASSLPPPIGMWERVEIDVTFAGTSHTVNVLWGTGMTRNNVANFFLSGSFQNGPPEFDLGIETFGKGTSGASVRYDDVIIDVAP